MEFRPTPDNDGYETVKNLINFRGDKETLHGTRYPSDHVMVAVETKTGDMHKGVLLRLSSELDQNTEYDEIRYSGFFFKLRNLNGRGHFNVYASPNSGGPTILPIDDWEGRGRGRYKYPIKSIYVEVIDEDDPVCRCGERMVFGYSEENENQVVAGDGSRGAWYGGWMCPECFPGRVRETEYLP